MRRKEILWKILYRLSERLAFLGKLGVQLWVLLKPLNTLEGCDVRAALRECSKLYPMMPRDASLPLYERVVYTGVVFGSGAS